MICPNCKRAISADESVCQNCGCPNIGSDVPRQVKIAWKPAIRKILLPLVLGAIFSTVLTALIAQSVLVRMYGKQAQAEILDTRSYIYKGMLRYVSDVQFVDETGKERRGTLNVGTPRNVGTPKNLQHPMDSKIDIRYVDFLSTVQGDSKISGLGDYFPFFYGGFIFLLIVAFVLLRTLKRRSILISGSVHHAKVTECYRKQAGRSSNWYISVVYDGKMGDDRTAATRTFPGKQEVGKTLWTIDKGTMGGVAIFDEGYEWAVRRNEL